MGRFRALINWLHLWLGLSSGIIVFIVCITGSVYVFHQEIKDTTEPWRFVEPQNKAFVPPSQLIDTAKAYVPHHEPTGLTYEGKEGAAAVGFWINTNGKSKFVVVFMNPYTAQFIKKEEPLAKGQFNFFHFIEEGHTSLWLPKNIGRPIVGSAVLIFVFLLLSGLIMWWPKKWNKTSLNKNFKIKWKASFKRLNYDLHNVLGFYMLLFGLIIATSGLIWSFDWFAHSFYYVTSAGESKPEHSHPHSDITQANLVQSDTIPGIDQAFYLALQQQANPHRIYITPGLHDDDDAYEIVMYKYQGKFYNHNTYFFDRYTLEPLRIKGDRYNETSFAQKLDMMNYDIHTGGIAGLPGKILVFLVSLICASLPVTGFIIWVKKKKNNQKQKYSLSHQLNRHASSF